VNVLVTGAAGGLGRAVLEQMPTHHDVVAWSHEDLDIGDHHAVMRDVVPLGLDAIVNCAAFTDVDRCEGERDAAYRANAIGPQNLALAARVTSSMLLHVSTDYVFDGEASDPYDELDEPRPLSVYGRSKLAGESLVQRLQPESFVVRTGYVFGGGDEYLTRAVRGLARGDAAGGLRDRTGTPTNVRDLAAAALSLLLTRRFGTYHLSGGEPATWFDVLERARRIGGLPGRVEPQRSADLGLRAPRPTFSALTSVFASDAGVAPARSLDEAIEEFLGRAL
jgi:dTDP-4-dehydrorhamnose reductase